MPIYPSNSDNSGFYNPDNIPSYPEEDYNSWLNTTRGILDMQTIRAIQKIIEQAPGLHAENLHLAGEEVIWLSRLTNGTQCPNYKRNQGQCGQSKCNICYGTNYVGGYSSPRKLKLSWQPLREDIVIEQEGLVEKVNPIAWTIPTIPLMKELDLIVTYNNERFLISSVDMHEKAGRKIYQNLNLVRADKFDVVYMVHVPTFYAMEQFSLLMNINIVSNGIQFPMDIQIINQYWG